MGPAQRGAQATSQDRVLAKLGLNKGGHASKGGQQTGKAGAALQSAAAPSGESLRHGCGRVHGPRQLAVPEQVNSSDSSCGYGRHSLSRVTAVIVVALTVNAQHCLSRITAISVDASQSRLTSSVQ